MIDYLITWVDIAPIVDCTAVTVERLLFENIVALFGCPRILMSDQGSHFINHTISALTEELQIQHKKSTPYHPQVNRMMEAFNKVLGHLLTKVCNANHNNWDLNILAVLWAYHTKFKRLTGQIPFKLVYGKEAVMPMEYIV